MLAAQILTVDGVNTKLDDPKDNSYSTCEVCTILPQLHTSWQKLGLR